MCGILTWDKILFMGSHMEDSWPKIITEEFVSLGKFWGFKKYDFWPTLGQKVLCSDFFCCLMTYSQIKIVYFFSLYHFDISFVLLLHHSRSPNHPLHHAVSFPHTVHYIDRHNPHPLLRFLLNQLNVFVKLNIRNNKDPCPKLGQQWVLTIIFQMCL